MTVFPPLLGGALEAVRRERSNTIHFQLIQS